MSEKVIRLDDCFDLTEVDGEWHETGQKTSVRWLSPSVCMDLEELIVDDNTEFVLTIEFARRFDLLPQRIRAENRSSAIKKAEDILRSIGSWDE